MTRAVLFAFVPNFYAEVERVRDRSLEGRPIIVGGDPRKRGLVQSATQDACDVGVRDAMPMLEALELCPHARALRTDMRRYREISKQLMASLRSGFERFETLGLDGAFLEDPKRVAAPEQTAATLCDRVREELGLPLRVGIAPIKFVARLAAKDRNAQPVCRVPDGAVQGYLRPLPVTRLPAVGPKTRDRLAALGAQTVGELAALDPEPLERDLGNHGLTIWELARGHDDSRVGVARHPQSVSQEVTFPSEEFDMAAISDRLQELSSGLEEALRRDGLSACRIAIKVRYADGETTTRSRKLPRRVGAARQVQALALELLGLTQVGSRRVRLLGISLAGLSRELADDRQLDLFS